jgi:hypothetical protein
MRAARGESGWFCGSSALLDTQAASVTPTSAANAARIIKNINL